MNNKIRFKNISKDYYEKEIINLKEYFSYNDFEILKKLNIEVKDKIYTNFEFDVMEEAVYLYYEIDKDIQNINAKALEEKNISIEDYNRLLNKINNIISDFNL